MRVGLSVGASVSPSPPRAASSAHTTRARALSLSLGSLVRLAGETTDASSLSDQVKRYKPRVFEREPPKADAPAAGPADPDAPKSAMSKLTMKTLQAQHNPARESLSQKCIKVVVDHFARFPVHENVPARDMRAITAALPVTLDPNVAATHVFDEAYWKRCCVERFGWQSCQLAEHGLTWKQLFFELHLQQRLEEFEPQYEDFGALLETVKACQDYVFSLKLRQLLAHPDMEQVCTLLPNLTRLDVTYGVKKIGMKYERMLFGMKISDANCLAKCIVNAENLTTLVLSSNLIDDDLLRMLMTGLIKNAQITHLDFSHNKITNHGVRLLSKLLGAQSVLTSLDLADNQIHAEGGRYLGRGLRANASLVDLNMRLNRLTDDGGRMLVEGLRSNSTLQRLNLSSNSLGSETTAALVTVVQEQTTPLMTLDLACNELRDEDLEQLHSALSSSNNRTLFSLDLRMNAAISEDSELIDEIGRLVHRNELEMRHQ